MQRRDVSKLNCSHFIPSGGSSCIFMLFGLAWPLLYKITYLQESQTCCHGASGRIPDVSEF